MATFTLVANTNIDALTSKAGSDTYNLSGFKLTVDQDSRYGTNNNTSAAMGNIVGSDNLGGEVRFDGTLVRLIPYDTGTGNVPASNTTISKGSASGLLIGVYSALNVAPTTAGSAMPASGYIKIKQWNSVAYSSGSLTGIGANATGADVAGWIEIVGVDALTTTIPRLSTLRATGEWYIIGTTDGSRSTTYQIPSNGSSAFYLPGVWVETAASSGTYEFYPCAGSQTALVANVATDFRGKVCWISTAGLLRFGHDGTNSTGGYLPVTGRKIRVGNVFFMCCTAATPTANVLPNATLATRYSTYPNTKGTVIFSKIAMNWFFRTLYCYSISVTDSCFMTSINHQSVKTAIAWSNIGIGQEAANPQTAMTLQTVYGGGSITDAVFTRATMASGAVGITLNDLNNITFTRNKFFSLAAKSNANAQAFNMVHCTNCTWNNLTVNGGSLNIATCADLTFNNTTYFDQLGSSTTPITNGVVLFDLVSGGDRIKVDGLDFGGLFMQQPYAGILRTGSAHVYNDLKIRNLGTPSSPLSLGGPERKKKSWSRVTTTCTVTDTAHGLKVNDNIYVTVCNNTTPVPLGSKTVASVPTADTFTFTATNSGATSGTLSYYPRVTAALYLIQWGADSLRAQRCYVPQVRSALLSDSNIVTSDTLVENVQSDYVISQTFFVQEGFYKGLGNIAPHTAQTSQFGTHWVDTYNTGVPTSTASQSWSRTTTTATVTSTDHNLKTNDVVIVTVTSDSSAIVLGNKTITVTDSDTFTFTCLNAGSASGTITYVPLNGRVGIIGCTPTTASSSQVSIDTGSTGMFTGMTDAVYQPTTNDQITWTCPHYILGHGSFPIAEAVLNPLSSGLTIASFNCYYSIDLNDGNGFSAFKNLYYQRTGAGGSSSSTTVTMTDTTGVAAGDYVWGTNIAPNAYVVSVDSSTNITVSAANTGTVSGTLRFNHIPSETVNSSLGFKLKIRLKAAKTITQTYSGFYIPTYSSTTGRAAQYDLDPVTVTITAKDVATGAAIQNAEVLLEAKSGGALPAGASVSITRSGSTATVSHTAHGLKSGQYVIIRGVNQIEYKGSKRITVVDANSYTFAVTGTPTTPATGTITSTYQVLLGVTDSDGKVTGTFPYTASQPVVGKVRKGTAATYYKTGVIDSTITSTGLDYLILLVKDS